jgi:nucleoside-diphosphate-sugar epimerase
MTILVTGANGYVGRNLVEHLVSQAHVVKALTGRTLRRHSHPGVFSAAIDLADPSAEDRLRDVLSNVAAVIHLAGNAHSRGARASNGTTYEELNSEAVERLARASIAANVKRFVLLSTIHVNGHRTTGTPFTEASPVTPASEYARSKWNGEVRLMRVAEASGLEWCVVRPPLVIGPSGLANLAKLTSLVATGLPLPFRSMKNRRNVVGMANLCLFLERCALADEAANALFLIADQPAISTADLIERLGAAMGRRTIQFPVPEAVWRILGWIPFTERRFGGLWESLEIDSSKAERQLGWRQARPLEESIRTAAGAKAHSQESD